MRKDILFTAFVSALIASMTSVGVIFASGPRFVFSDVPQDAFYANSVFRMSQLGVMTGYSDTQFGPNDPVTRGQLATTLDRYDKQLLKPGEYGTYNGLYKLHQVICLGGLDFQFENQDADTAYEELCDVEFPSN